jgi:hypothetical protein
MAGQSTAGVMRTPGPAVSKPPVAPKGNKNSFVMGVAVVVVLAGVLTTWGVIRHRRTVRALAEQQALAQLVAQQQEEVRQQAAAAALQEAALSNSAQGTPEQATAPGSPAGQPPAGSTPASSTSSSSPTHPSPAGSTSGPAGDKKSSTKAPPKTTPSKQTGSNPQTSATSTNSAGAPPSSQPPQQQPPPTNAGQQSSTTPAPAAVKPPAPTTTANSSNPPPASPPAANAPIENAKLHIDDGRVPMGASFVVVMDGKTLFQRGVLVEGKPDPTKDDLVVPPGSHEFRVITAPGGVQVGDSKTVRADFVSKKKMTLRIELRDNSSGQSLKKSSKLDAGAAEFMISLKAAGLLGF